jgi:predicted DNA-binding protein YlxM (UPF0122 family)
MIRTPEQTLQLLCDAWRVDINEIKHGRKTSDLVTYRHAALVILYKNMGLSQEEIAKTVNVQRTAIVYAGKKVADSAIFDPRLHAVYTQGMEAMLAAEASFEGLIKKIVDLSKEIGRNEVRLAIQGDNHTMYSTQKSLIEQLRMIRSKVLATQTVIINTNIN